MTPETATLYRQVAQALDARGAAHGLLDVCPDTGLTEDGCHSGVVYGYRPFQDVPCITCRGTGTVVPSEAECFLRLFKVAGSRHYELDWRGIWTVDDDGDTASHNPLAALLRAMAQSLGLEVAA